MDDLHCLSYHLQCMFSYFCAILRSSNVSPGFFSSCEGIVCGSLIRLLSYGVMNISVLHLAAITLSSYSWGFLFTELTNKWYTYASL